MKARGSTLGIHVMDPGGTQWLLLCFNTSAWATSGKARPFRAVRWRWRWLDFSFVKGDSPLGKLTSIDEPKSLFMKCIRRSCAKCPAKGFEHIIVLVGVSTNSGGNICNCSHLAPLSILSSSSLSWKLAWPAPPLEWRKSRWVQAFCSLSASPILATIHPASLDKDVPRTQVASWTLLAVVLPSR